MRSLRLPEGTRERWVSEGDEEVVVEDWKASRRDLREAGLGWSSDLGSGEGIRLRWEKQVCVHLHIEACVKSQKWSCIDVAIKRSWRSVLFRDIKNQATHLLFPAYSEKELNKCARSPVILRCVYVSYRYRFLDLLDSPSAHHQPTHQPLITFESTTISRRSIISFRLVAPALSDVTTCDRLAPSQIYHHRSRQLSQMPSSTYVSEEAHQRNPTTC
jgi:hypothetical protein